MKMLRADEVWQMCFTEKAQAGDGRICARKRVGGVNKMRQPHGVPRNGEGPLRSGKGKYSLPKTEEPRGIINEREVARKRSRTLAERRAFAEG